VRALKFGLVGVANTGLDVALFATLTYVAGVRPVPANIVSYSAGILLSFAVNRAWTFSDRQRQGGVSQLALFAAGSLAGLGMSTLVIALLAGPCGPLIAKILSIGVTFVWNYVYSNFVVFKAKAP
jgi:putative flippase GtrA